MVDRVFGVVFSGFLRLFRFPDVGSSVQLDLDLSRQSAFEVDDPQRLFFAYGHTFDLNLITLPNNSDPVNSKIHENIPFRRRFWSAWASRDTVYRWCAPEFLGRLPRRTGPWHLRWTVCCSFSPAVDTCNSMSFTELGQNKSTIWSWEIKIGQKFGFSDQNSAVRS